MPGILNTVIQAAALSALSNVLAQLITAYREKVLHLHFAQSPSIFGSLRLFVQMAYTLLDLICEYQYTRNTHLRQFHSSQHTLKLLLASLARRHVPNLET
jgi:hypothetical protein